MATNTRETLGTEATLNALVSNSASLTTFVENNCSTLGKRALYQNTNLTSIEMPNVTTVGESALEGCTGLTSVDLSGVETINGSNAMKGCTSLTSITLDDATSLNTSTFENCTALTTVSMPNLTTVSNSAFKGCTSLTSVSFPKVTSVQQSAFQNCTSLQRATFASPNKVTFNSSNFNGCKNFVHLKITGESEVATYNASMFTGSPFEYGYGTISVPASMLSSYEANSNWQKYFLTSDMTDVSTFNLTKADTIQDTWAQISAKADPSSDYSIGDTKTISFTYDNVNYIVQMQIVGFNQDTKSDDTGKAKISWLGKFLPFTMQMNPTSTTSNGWGGCALRTTLNGDIYNALDSDLKSAIVQVKKPYYCVTPSAGTLYSDDKLWVPSLAEFGFVSTGSYNAENHAEITNASYVAAFGNSNLTTSNQTAYVLKIFCGSAQWWWLRSAYSANSFCNVYSNGNAYGYGANSSGGVALGFCT